MLNQNAILFLQLSLLPCPFILILLLRIPLSYVKSLRGLHLEVTGKLLEIVVGNLDFRKDLGPRQLVDFVGEVIGCSVGLDSELQLRDNFLVYGDLESDVADGLRVGEPALNLGYPESLFWVILDKLLDLVYSQNDILHLKEDTLPPDHITDLEGHLLLLLQKPINSFFVVLVLPLNGLLNTLLWHFIEVLSLPEKHLFLDADHCFFVGVIRVELDTHLGLNCHFEASLPDELFKVISPYFSHISIL